MQIAEKEQDTTSPVRLEPEPTESVVCPLQVGALVDLNGGHFKIKSLGGKCVVLEALAGTTPRKV